MNRVFERKGIRFRVDLKAITNGSDYFLNFKSPQHPKPISTLTTLFKRQALIDMGILNMEMVNDESIYLRALLVGDAGFIDEIAGVYRVHGDNITFNLSCDFIIQNLDEKFMIKVIAVDQYGYDKELMDKWMENSAFGTISYYLSNTSVTSVDVDKLRSWVEKKAPGVLKMVKQFSRKP